MKKAVFIKDVSDKYCWRKSELYYLYEPIIYEGENSNVTHYIIVCAESMAINTMIPETYMFPANSSGDILDWVKLSGSQRGICDIEAALLAAGYAIEKNIKTNPNDLFEIRYNQLRLTNKGQEIFYGNISRQYAMILSIKKWAFITKYIKETSNIPRDGGLVTCALCKLYTVSDCIGCPVFQHTKNTNCNDSPYDQYLLALRGDNIQAAIDAATDEIVFLASLL